MIQKSLLIVFILSIICQSVQANDFGIRMLVSPSGQNKCKDYGFTKFLPENKIKFDLNDKNLILMQIKNAKGELLMTKEDIIIQGKDNNLVINVQKAQTNINFSFGIIVTQKNQKMSCEFSYSLLMSFTKSEQGRLIVQDITLSQFNLDEKSIILPGLIQKMRKQLYNFISKEIQKQIKQKVSTLKDVINQQLNSIPQELEMKNTQISLDITIDLPQITENMLILQIHGYAFNNQKEKQRSQLVNQIEFPEFETMNKEYIVMISEYTINSFLEAMFDSGDLQSTFDVSYLSEYQSFNTLKLFLQGFSYNPEQSQKKELFIQSISKPVVTIQETSILTKFSCFIELKEYYDQEEQKLFQLKTTVELNFNVHILDNNYIYFQIDKIQFDNFEFVGSQAPSSLIQPLLNGILDATKDSLDEKLKQRLIPINNKFFNIQEPNLYLHKQHIIIEGNINFNNIPS